MLKIDKIIIIKDGQHIDVTSTFGGVLCNSYDEVHETLKELGFSHYLFRLKEAEGND